MKKKLYIKSKDLKVLFLREKRWEIVLPWPSKICHFKRKRKCKIKKEPLCKGLTFPEKNTNAVSLLKITSHIRKKVIFNQRHL